MNRSIRLFSATAALVALVVRSVSAEWGSPPQCDFSLEMVWLQDFSDSSADDRVVIADQLMGLLTQLDNTYEQNDVGFASFVDKPIDPFGYGPQGSWFDGDWCLNVTTDLDFAGSNQDKVNIFVAGGPGGGQDWAENQLGALHDLAKGPLAGWNPANVTPGGRAIKRVIVISTDSAYHTAGEGLPLGLYANNGDGETVCAEEDYPSIQQVSDALKSRDVYVVFLIGSTDVADDVYDVYTELLDSLDVRGGVYRVEADGSNVLDIMEEALEDLEDDVCDRTVDVMFTQDVTYSYNNDFPNFQQGLGDFVTTVSGIFDGPKFGLASFGDKPMLPFGHGPSGDYCVRIDAPLTEDGASVIAAGGSLKLTSGIDWRESQIDGAMTSALSSQVVWRLGDFYDGKQLSRVIVLATDAGYHRAPDGASAGFSLLAHPGTAIDNLDCTAYEYPTIDQLGDALELKDAHIVFVPTSDVRSIYVDLLDYLQANYNVAGEVVELKDWSDWPGPTAAAVKRVARKVARRQRA